MHGEVINVHPNTKNHNCMSIGCCREVANGNHDSSNIIMDSKSTCYVVSFLAKCVLSKLSKSQVIGRLPHTSKRGFPGDPSKLMEE